MKKLLQTLALASCLAAASGTNAQIVVPDYGDTGWQTFSRTLGSTFNGTVRIGVANEGDDMVSSRLLLDNFQGLSLTNPSFETGDFSGWNLVGSGSVSSSTTADLGTVYGPTDGTYFAELSSGSSESADWLDALLPPGYDAYNGSWLEFNVNIPAGATVSFDWAFLAGDHVPFHDFAFLWYQEPGAAPSLEPLAYIDSVPEPAPLVLMALGLLVTTAVGRRKEKSVA